MSAINDNYALIDSYIQAYPYTKNSFIMNNATKIIRLIVLLISANENSNEKAITVGTMK